MSEVTLVTYTATYYGNAYYDANSQYTNSLDGQLGNKPYSNNLTTSYSTDNYYTYINGYNANSNIATTTTNSYADTGSFLHSFVCPRGFESGGGYKNNITIDLLTPLYANLYTGNPLYAGPTGDSFNYLIDKFSNLSFTGSIISNGTGGYNTDLYTQIQRQAGIPNDYGQITTLNESKYNIFNLILGYTGPATSENNPFLNVNLTLGAQYKASSTIATSILTNGLTLYNYYRQGSLPSELTNITVVTSGFLASDFSSVYTDTSITGNGYTGFVGNTGSCYPNSLITPTGSTGLSGSTGGYSFINGYFTSGNYLNTGTEQSSEPVTFSYLCTKEVYDSNTQIYTDTIVVTMTYLDGTTGSNSGAGNFVAFTSEFNTPVPFSQIVNVHQGLFLPPATSYMPCTSVARGSQNIIYNNGGTINEQGWQLQFGCGDLPICFQTEQCTVNPFTTNNPSLTTSNYLEQYLGNGNSGSNAGWFAVFYQN